MLLSSFGSAAPRALPCLATPFAHATNYLDFVTRFHGARSAFACAPRSHTTRVVLHGALLLCDITARHRRRFCCAHRAAFYKRFITSLAYPALTGCTYARAALAASHKPHATSFLTPATISFCAARCLHCCTFVAYSWLCRTPPPLPLTTSCLPACSLYHTNK